MSEFVELCKRISVVYAVLIIEIVISRTVCVLSVIVGKKILKIVEVARYIPYRGKIALSIITVAAGYERESSARGFQSLGFFRPASL